GDLGDLVAGAVATERLGEPTEHEVAVGFEHHVDEIDDHHAADVTQAQLADDLLGGLEVVLGDRLLEVAARAGVLAGVDVDHGHGLGPVDHERAAGGQPHLPVERLGQLLVHSVRGEHVDLRVLVSFEPLEHFGRDPRDVLVHGVPRLAALDDELGEVLVEQVAHDLDQKVRFLVQRHRGAGRGGLPLLGGLRDLGPLGRQPGHVAADLLLADAFGRRTDDHARVLGDDLLEDGLEPTAFGVRELAGDAGGVPVRHVDEEPAGQRDLRGQPGALLPDGVLGDLHQHHVPGLERLLDPAGLAAEARGLPVDFTGVADAVASPPDVDERGLHAGQDVLDATEVDVADHGACRLGGDEVFDEDLVLEHPDLGHQAVAFRARLLAHHHHAVHGLPAGQELGLGEDGLATTPGLAAFPARQPLGLVPGRPGAARHLVRGRAGALSPASGPPLRVPLVDLGLRRVVIAAPRVVGTGAGAPTAATTAAATTTRT